MMPRSFVVRMVCALLATQHALAAGMQFSVRVAAVEQRELAPSMWVPGTVVSRHDAWLAMEVEGRLTQVAEVGDAVPEGGMLAQVDAYPLQLAVEDAEANVKALKASLTFNEKQLKRLQELARTDSASRTQRDEIQARREVVRQDLARAQVRLRQTEYALKRGTLTAPFPGRVVARERSRGEYARAGDAVVRLVDIEYKEVRANAPMRVAPYIEAGMTLTLRVNDGLSSHGVRAVVPVGDVSSRSLELRLPVIDDALLVGSPVRIAVPTAGRSVQLAVPRDAVLLRSDGGSVVKVHEGETQIIPVQVRAVAGDWVGVTGVGLNAGDQVVVRGGERLRPGQQVQVLAE